MKRQSNMRRRKGGDREGGNLFVESKRKGEALYIVPGNGSASMFPGDGERGVGSDERVHVIAVEGIDSGRTIHTTHDEAVGRLGQR